MTTRQSKQEDALERKLTRLINKRFDQIEQMLQLKGTTLVTAAELQEELGIGHTYWHEHKLYERIPSIQISEGSRGKRYIKELAVPALAGML